MQLGYSFGGSHKADLKIKALGIPVEDILSRGQLKLLMCALRLAQGQYLTETTGKQCIYLIDDFASELDMSKRALLVQTLQNINAQVFVSCIHPKQMEEPEISSISELIVKCEQLARYWIAVGETRRSLASGENQNLCRSHSFFRTETE